MSRPSAVTIRDRSAVGWWIVRSVPIGDDAGAILYEIEEAIAEMKADRSSSTDFIVEGYSGSAQEGPELLGSNDWEKVATFAALFVQHGDPFRAYVDCLGSKAIPAAFADAKAAFEAAFKGYYSCAASYVQQACEEEVPAGLAPCIDWAAKASADEEAGLFVGVLDEGWGTVNGVYIFT